jgi:hypothetical protein
MRYLIALTCSGTSVSMSKFKLVLEIYKYENGHNYGIIYTTDFGFESQVIMMDTISKRNFLRL